MKTIFGYKFITLLIFTLIPFIVFSQSKNPPSDVTAMVIYAKDNEDNYPMPSKPIREIFYSRLTELFESISYGKHKLKFKETLNDSGYFVSDHLPSYYKKNYERKRHIRGFGMFNEEILYKVKARYGDPYFSDVDLIIVLGPDGGRDYYHKGVNATGYGMLGVDFAAGNKIFRKTQGKGGFTVEIGASMGTKDPGDDKLFTVQEIIWNMAHEYGHWLKLGHRSDKLGIYSLMVDEVNSNERMPEFGPQPLDIFHIIQLGWINEKDSTRVKIITNETQSAAVSLNQIRSHEGLILARIDIPNSKEQFYLSYHRQNANFFDGVYMGEGLLIWHRRGGIIDVECAAATGPDGQDHLDEKTDSGGLPTDFFSSGRSEFTPTTNPNTHAGLTKRDKRSPTGIAITDIRESGDQVTFKVTFRK